jgi:hypothetical protein
VLDCLLIDVAEYVLSFSAIIGCPANLGVILAFCQHMFLLYMINIVSNSLSPMPSKSCVFRRNVSHFIIVIISRDYETMAKLKKDLLTNTEEADGEPSQINVLQYIYSLMSINLSSVRCVSGTY